MRTLVVVWAVCTLLLMCCLSFAAETSYTNSGELVLSPTSRTAVSRKPVKVDRLLAIAPATYCQTRDGFFAWQTIRCVARLEEVDGTTLYRRGMWSNGPEPAQDLFPGGVDVRGLVLEWMCHAEENIDRDIVCHGTSTMVSK